LGAPLARAQCQRRRYEHHFLKESRMKILNVSPGAKHLAVPQTNAKGEAIPSIIYEIPKAEFEGAGKLKKPGVCIIPDDHMAIAMKDKVVKAWFNDKELIVDKPAKAAPSGDGDGEGDEDEKKKGAGTKPAAGGGAAK
jgi:hypothetical protein